MLDYKRLKSEEFIQHNIAKGFNEFTNKNFTFENAYSSCVFQDWISDWSYVHKIHKKMAFLQCGSWYV